jgi:putative transposase
VKVVPDERPKARRGGGTGLDYPRVTSRLATLGCRTQSLWDWSGTECANPSGIAPRLKLLQPACTMPQSLSAVYIHLVFSTKDRRPFLRDKSVSDKLHAQLGGITKTLECPPLLVGGVEDHVHLLCRFGRTITQAEWVKEIKRVSSTWIKEQGRDYADFEWQGGYADFSVSKSNLDEVERYIAEQETHHRKMSFQEELRALLRKHEVEFDERYVWD